MNLYANLELEREPFSNSPDPGFLHETRQHASCLQELEISLRLRRGLCVVTGDIGTGKTTLCRGLLRAFAADQDADLHLLLDPHFDTPEEFLRVILGSVSRLTPDPAMGLWELKEALKQQLFRLGMVERRLVALVIDEGQKLSPENLELLREMLNYETNSAKLLQIVIFAQLELEPMLDAMPNLTDRINVRRRLTPLSFAETRSMIRHRLNVAAGEDGPRVSFTPAAVWSIHRAAGGSPRKIVRLCHMAMLEMLLRGKTRVGLSEARAARNPREDESPRSRRAMGAAMAVLVFLGGLWTALDTTGPVLGPASTQSAPGREAALRLPQAALEAAAADMEKKPEALAQPSGPGQKAPAVAEARPGASADGGADASPVRGLTLAREQGEAQATPAGLTLQPQRDQGPAVRSPIADVERGGPPARGALFSERTVRTLAQGLERP